MPDRPGEAPPSISRTSLKPIPEEALTGNTSPKEQPPTVNVLDKAHVAQPAAKRQRIDNHCHVCGTTYTERRTLLRHLRSPSHCQRAGLPVRHYPCPHCSRHFTRNDLLQRHVRESHRGWRRGAPAPRLGHFATIPAPDAAGFEEDDGKAADESHQPAPDEPSRSSETSSSPSTGDSICSTPSILTECSALSAPHYSHESSFGGSVDAEIHLPATECTSDMSMRDEQPIDLADAMSIMSISTTASLRSAASVHVPFRSRVLQFVKGGSTPRPQALLYVAPCPLCNQELGKTSDQVKSHIDRHYQELCGEVELSCKICRVSFVHAKDLEWHLASANRTGSCGFTFFHTRPCSGHHPPVDFTTAHSEAHSKGAYEHCRMPRTDHASFTRQLRQWEIAQLSEYRQYLEDHANGRIATNAPAYAAPASPLFRRSTGSVQSAYTYLSSRSSPPERGGRLRRITARSGGGKGNEDPVDIARQHMHSRNSALDLAIRCSDLATARRLVASKADLTANGGLKSKVMTAFRNANEEMLRFLLDIESRPSDTVAAPPNDPAAWNLLEFLSLWDHIPRENDRQRATCISIVRRHLVFQDLDAVYRALGAGSEPLLRSLDLEQVYEQGQTALLHFLRTNHVEYVMALLEAGANVNVTDYNGTTALMLACRWGYLDLVQRCISAGANVDAFDKEGTTALMFACQCSSVDSVSLLLRAGANLATTDWAGKSALMFACSEHGRADFVQRLLDAGAAAARTIDARDMEGRTSLMLACQYGHVDSVRLLLHAGADANAKDPHGRTSLMIACQQQFADIVSDLLLADSYDAASRMYSCAVSGLPAVHARSLDADPNVDATDRKGCTALMRACRLHSRQVVKALLDANASLDIIDHDGMTAWMHAVDIGDPAIADLLVQAGAGRDCSGRSVKHAASEARDDITAGVLGRGTSALDSYVPPRRHALPA